MSRDLKASGSQSCDEFLKEHFPYVKRGESGEFIIPAERIESFVITYQMLCDNADHQERLRQYRAGGKRLKPAEIDD